MVVKTLSLCFQLDSLFVLAAIAVRRDLLQLSPARQAGPTTQTQVSREFVEQQARRHMDSLGRSVLCTPLCR